MSVDCVHHRPHSTKTGFGLCVINAAQGPSDGYCNKICKMREPFPPGTFVAIEPPPPETFQDKMKRLGPPLWADLHARTLGASDPLDVEGETKWLEKFTMRVPCGKCRKHWRELLEKMPPDSTSRAGYVAWAVKIHNAVNAVLGKPEFVP